jgi:hypothetical protein
VESRPEEHPERGEDENVNLQADGHAELRGGQAERPADGHAELRAGQAELSVGEQVKQGADPHAQAFVTGGAYALLFLFGAAQGLIGCFHFSWGIGPVPLAALGFCTAILATCLLGAAAMGSAAGALLPALGWFLVSVVLTMPTAQGSVIVTNTVAGDWYLYGGSACAAAGVVIALVRRIGASAGRGPASSRGPASGGGPASRRGPASGRGLGSRRRPASSRGPAGRGPAHGQSAQGSGL